jgi:hypothetical protein
MRADAGGVVYVHRTRCWSRGQPAARVWADKTLTPCVLVAYLAGLVKYECQVKYV